MSQAVLSEAEIFAERLGSDASVDDVYREGPGAGARLNKHGKSGSLSGLTFADGSRIGTEGTHWDVAHPCGCFEGWDFCGCSKAGPSEECTLCEDAL